MAETETLCARCARLGKTCCQISEIYVTPGDVARITDFVGNAGFYEFRAPENWEYCDQDDDPEWAACVFRPDGTRRVLRREQNGDCCFLGPQGCALPLEVRPLVCRLYPFTYTAEGLQPELAPGCPVVLLPPGVTLLQALGMSAEQAEIWRQQLYAEIHLEPHLQPVAVLGTVVPASADNGSKGPASGATGQQSYPGRMEAISSNSSPAQTFPISKASLTKPPC